MASSNDEQVNTYFTNITNIRRVTREMLEQRGSNLQNALNTRFEYPVQIAAVLSRYVDTDIWNKLSK